jgi:hypothetical protein
MKDPEEGHTGGWITPMFPSQSDEETILLAEFAEWQVYARIAFAEALKAVDISDFATAADSALESYKLRRDEMLARLTELRRTK